MVLTPFAVRVLPTATRSLVVLETSKNSVPPFNVRLLVRFSVPAAPNPPGASPAPALKFTLAPMVAALPVKTVVPPPATVRLPVLVMEPVRVNVWPGPALTVEAAFKLIGLFNVQLTLLDSPPPFNVSNPPLGKVMASLTNRVPALTRVGPV